MPPFLPAVLPLVRQQDSSTTNTEQRIGDEHALGVAKVPVLCDVLSGDHQGIGVGLELQHLPRQVHSNDTRRAAHAAKVVVDGLAAHLEVVHDNRAQGGSGVEEGAVDNEDANLMGLHTCLGKHLPYGTKADL